MGIFSWGAKKLKKTVDTDVEKVPPSGKRLKRSQGGYRGTAFRVPTEATRGDLAQVFEDLLDKGEIGKEVVEESFEGGVVFKKKKLKFIATDITGGDLARVTEDLVNGGELERAAVEDSMEGIVGITRDKINAAAETGRLLDETEKINLLAKLEARFTKNSENPEFQKTDPKIKWPKMHKGIEWSKVLAKLEEADPEKLWSLNEMEKRGGEPDVVRYDKKTKEYIFIDCSLNTPKIKGIKLFYNREGQEEESNRFDSKRYRNAVDMAQAIGVSLLDEKEYRNLQNLGFFDLKSRTWLKTPKKTLESDRALVGLRAFFMNWLHVTTFSQSDSGCEGFRAMLRI